MELTIGKGLLEVAVTGVAETAGVAEATDSVVSSSSSPSMGAAVVLIILVAAGGAVAFSKMKNKQTISTADENIEDKHLLTYKEVKNKFKEIFNKNGLKWDETLGVASVIEQAKKETEDKILSILKSNISDDEKLLKINEIFNNIARISLNGKNELAKIVKEYEEIPLSLEDYFKYYKISYEDFSNAIEELVNQMYKEGVEKIQKKITPYLNLEKINSLKKILQ